VELFNLRKDPREQQSIADSSPKVVERLMGILNAHTATEKKKKTLP